MIDGVLYIYVIDGIIKKYNYIIKHQYETIF
jgi:hypothetical protein